MRLVVAKLVITVFAIICATVHAQAETWRIDPSKTRIGFRIESTAWPATSGSFQRFDGRVSLDFDRPSRSSVRFVVQSASVDLGSRGLNDYVRSSVFFDAPQFPTMTFTSTRVDKIDDRTARVAGDLSLLGVTRPITLTVNVDRARRGGAAVGLTAHGQIHRSEFGMNSGVPVISDIVDITVSTEAVGAP